MALLHESRAPSPSLSGFNTPLSDPPSYCRFDAETPCTPEMDLTPTQCVIRNVLSMDTGRAVEPEGGGRERARARATTRHQARNNRSTLPTAC
ncbi:hypothetical protein OYC64_010530 [Pagothenia borchgrevinki]|uniref:Uncharacterized protein n=1 Tax=Pagothenia borchgrevinki TaxID=8213 RepID=A0ABD2GW68_PAGBO